MKSFLGFPRPGLLGLALVLCALALPASALANPAISVAPAGPLDYGNQDILTPPQASQYKTVIVYSMGSGANSTLVLGNVAITGNSAFYEVQDNCTGESLTPLQSCSVVLAFDPDTTGAKAGALNIQSNAGVAMSVGLTGTGTATGVFSPNETSHSFAPVDVADGAPSSGFFRVTNAGSASMTFTSVGLTGAGATSFAITSNGCSGQTIAISAYCDVEVAFDPQSAGAKAATLHFVHNGVGGASDISLTGTGKSAKFKASAASLPFGIVSVPAGPSTMNLTITNEGDFPLTISDAAFTGSGASEFAVDTGAANTCDDGPVAVAGTCVLPVQFDPTDSGAASASLVISHNDTSTSTPRQSTIALSGTGTQALATASPGLVQYDSQDLFSGPTGSKTVTVSNVGQEQLSVNSASLVGDDADEFTVTGGTCTVAPPVSLAPGQSCTFLVAFDPESVDGGRTATLSVVHSGVNSPAEAQLAGFGVSAALGSYPGALAFEQRMAGQGSSAPQWVRFENYGTGPLKLNEQTIAGAAAADYVIYYNDCAGRTLVPSEYCDVAVSFNPRAAGTRAAVLRMTHGPLPATVTDVPLSGSATAPPQLKMTVVYPKNLRMSRTKAVIFTVKCPATCTVTANANLLLPGKGKKSKRSTLGWKQVTVKGGDTGKIVFKLAGGQRVALTNAARAGKKVRVSASFSAWAEGYSEAVATTGFKLK